MQQYQQALLQQQMLAQQQLRSRQAQSPEYITSPQDFSPALISYPGSLPVHAGTVADSPYPASRQVFWHRCTQVLPPTFLIVMSTAESFPQKLLASIVMHYLKELDSCCLVVKDILGGGWNTEIVNRWAWYNFLKNLSSIFSSSWIYSRSWLLTTSLKLVSGLCWMSL